jgi:GMP synthase-like glutamine amidotransferase
MRVLVIQHAAFEHLGTLAPVLASRALECDHLDLYRNPQAPCDLTSYAGLIVMGGPMSANDDLPYLARELHLIGEALASDTPVLGICLGSQLLARAAGARVYRNTVKEIGWAPVYWTEAAREDLLFAGFERPETVFHWHGETFDLPAGAQWLGWSDACRHQAFRLGRAYGLQFHLEVTPGMVSDWLSQDANHDDVAGLTATVDPAAHAASLEKLSATVFGRWCELVETAARNP